MSWKGKSLTVKPQILILGGSGQLGAAWRRSLNAEGLAYESPSHEDADIATPAIESYVASKQWSLVVNAAAHVKVAACEDEPSRAYLLNAQAAYWIARGCRQTGAPLVTYSTDYVFNGMAADGASENDVATPLQTYGVSKAAGELAARATHPGGCYVIRTSGLYGAGGAGQQKVNFVDARLRDAKHHATIEISCEQRTSPTLTDDLVVASRALIGLRAEPGVYHLTNEGSCSWAEFTAAAFDIAGMSTRVVPVDRGGLDGAMQRPRNSVLVNNKARALGITLPPWRDALARYLNLHNGPDIA